MASSQHAPETQQRLTKTKNEVPYEVGELLAKSARVGTATGACGLLFGATYGILRSKVPIIFSLATALQWFGLGSIFHGARTVAIARHGPDHPVTPYEKVKASAFGAATSGATVSGLLYGPKSIFRGAFTFSLVAASGQFAVNKWTAFRESRRETNDSWLESKRNPLKKLTHREYEDLLEEKLLKMNAEIALIDDKIAALRAAKEEELKAAATKPPPTGLTAGKS